MKFLYAAHEPFVILFLVFVVCFIVSNSRKRRGSR